jgi:hypothetical protein
MMARKRTVFVGMVMALALGISPSRGEDDPSHTLTIRQHRFEPAELEIPAGKKIALLVKNLDTTPEEFESIELHREKVVAGGSEITVYVGPLKPGRYEFFGDFNPDTARGHLIAK